MLSTSRIRPWISFTRRRPTAPSPTLVDGKGRGQVASRFDDLQTYAASGLTSLCTLFAFRLAHQSLGDAGFAEPRVYGVIAFVVPLLSIGMAVAIAKFVACRVVENRTSESIECLSAGLLLTAIGTAAFCAAIFVFPRPISFLCTGADDRAGLVLQVLAVCFRLTLDDLWMCLLSGLDVDRCFKYPAAAMRRALLPAAILFGVNDLGTYLLRSGFAVCALSGVAIAAIYATSSAGKRLPSTSTTRSLLRFGLPRVPGDAAYYGLLVAPAAAATYRSGIQAGGEIAYALAWLTLLGQFVAPSVPYYCRKRRFFFEPASHTSCGVDSDKLLRASLLLTTILVLFLAYFAPQIIELHLSGSCSRSVVHTVRTMLVAAIPLNAFICLRSVVDAGESKAVCPRLCLVAFTLFCGLSLLFYGLKSTNMVIACTFVVAVSVLAILSAFAAYRVLSRREHITHVTQNSTLDPAGI